MTDDGPEYDESVREHSLRKRIDAQAAVCDGIDNRVTDCLRQLHTLEDRLNSLWQKLGELGQY